MICSEFDTLLAAVTLQASVIRQWAQSLRPMLEGMPADKQLEAIAEAREVLRRVIAAYGEVQAPLRDEDNELIELARELKSVS